jgi:hypothetical protein
MSAWQWQWNWACSCRSASRQDGDQLADGWACHCSLALDTKTGYLEQARAALAAAMALYRVMQMQFWLQRTEATLARVLHATGSLGVSY